VTFHQRLNSPSFTKFDVGVLRENLSIKHEFQGIRHIEAMLYQKMWIHFVNFHILLRIYVQFDTGCMYSSVEHFMFVKSATGKDVILKESCTKLHYCVYREIVWYLHSREGLGKVCVLCYRGNIKHCRSFAVFITPQLQTSYVPRGNENGKNNEEFFQLVLAMRTHIPQDTTVKYLDIHLDRRLTWKTHVNTKRKQLGLQLKRMY